MLLNWFIIIFFVLFEQFFLGFVLLPMCNSINQIFILYSYVSHAKNSLLHLLQMSIDRISIENVLGNKFNWKHLNCFVDMSNCLAISMTSVDSRKKRVFSLISFIHYCSEASNKTARLKTKYIPSKHPFQTSIFTRSQWHNAHDYHSGQCPWSNQNVSTILSMFFS